MTRDDFAARLRAKIATMPKVKRMVAQYFAQNPLEVIAGSANDLAAAVGTSDATIIRTAQALGYAGLSDLKRELANALAIATPAERFRHTLGGDHADARRVLERTLAAQTKWVSDLASEEAKATLEAIALLLLPVRRIVLFGLGPTKHIAAYGAQMLQRHGRDIALLGTPGSGMADELLKLRKDDGLLIFSYGRAYPEVWATITESLSLALPIALLTDSTKSPLAPKADEVAIVPRGDANGMAMHGATMVWLEALVTMMSALNSSQTQESLKKLERLRKDVSSNSLSR
ncbi:MAG: MurR/RpiR family transcriptional regulator [Devosia sp.]|nr:MurR/RpiR family transcriptional regulator [Devosia sp.]